MHAEDCRSSAGEEAPNGGESAAWPLDALSREDAESNATAAIEVDGDAMRARAGFGRDESGVVPSGRCSIPGIYAGGEAPPPMPGLNDGIDMSTLEQCIEVHVRRILAVHVRSLSVELPAVEDGSETQSTHSLCSPSLPSRSLSSSPVPGRGHASSPEDVTVGISVRLCWRRCGSSSAVLELVLDHGSDCLSGAGLVAGAATCSELHGCCCRPPPPDAEARLLAHFARHSFLRLAVGQLPVRVQLEPLPPAEPEEPLQHHTSSTEAGQSRGPSELPTLPEEPHEGSPSGRRRLCADDGAGWSQAALRNLAEAVRIPRAALYCTAYRAPSSSPRPVRVGAG